MAVEFSRPDSGDDLLGLLETDRRASPGGKIYHPYAWSATTIGYILKRPEYTGRKVLGKTVCENYNTQSTRKTTPEEQEAEEKRLAAYRRKKAKQQRKRREGKKSVLFVSICRM